VSRRFCTKVRTGCNQDCLSACGMRIRNYRIFYLPHNSRYKINGSHTTIHTRCSLNTDHLAGFGSGQPPAPTHRTQQPRHQVYPQVRKQESELTFLSDKRYCLERLLFKRPPKDPALGPVDEPGAQNLLQTGEGLANPDMGTYIQFTP
jgi:hypothetical protein